MNFFAISKARHCFIIIWPVSSVLQIFESMSPFLFTIKLFSISGVNTKFVFDTTISKLLQQHTFRQLISQSRFVLAFSSVKICNVKVAWEWK